MIEVFKTNINHKKDAERMLKLLHSALQNHHINFDLEDCDRILRVENRNNTIDIPFIENILEEKGFHCEVLPD